MAGGGTEVGRISIKVTPDTDGFRRKLVRDLAGADKDIEVDVKPKNIKETRERIKEGTKGIEAEVDVKPEVNMGRLAAARERIKAALGRQKIEVEVDVDRDRSRGITSLLDKLDGIGGKAPSFGTGINAAGYAVILAGILAVAAPLIGLITSALLTLPGLVSLVATPIGALVLGMGGLKEAAGRLQEPFKALQGVMSEAVKQQFTPVFDELAKVFPTLQASLPTVTKGLADMASAVVKTLTSSEGLKRIEATATNIGKAFSQAAPGIAGFVDGFTNLALQFSKKLPDIAEWFNGAGKSFSQWVNKITADGTLSKAFDGLGQSLRIVLDLLGDLGTKGIEFFKNPEGIENFKRGLTEIKDAINDIVSLSGKVSELVGLFDNFLPDLNMDGFLKDITTPFTSKDAPWRKWIEDPPPLDTGKAIRQQRQALADIMGVQYSPSMFPTTAAGQQFIDSLTNSITNQGPQVQGATKQIFAGLPAAAAAPGTATGQSFIDGLQNGITGGGVGIPTASNQIVESLIPKPEDVEKKAQETLATLTTALGGQLDTNSDLGAQLSEKINQATTQAGTALTEGLQGLSTTFQTQLAEIGTGTAAQIQSALQPLQAAPKAVAEAFNTVTSVITGAFAQVVGSVSLGAGQIATALGSGLAQVPGVVTRTFNNLAAIATAGMTGLVTAVVQGCAQAVAAIQPLPRQIAAIGSQLFSAAQSAGAQVGAGMAVGITASTGQAVAAAQAMAAAVTAASQVKLGIKSPSRVFADIGDNVGKGFVMGVEGQSNNMIGSIKEILEAVKEVFGSANGLNLNFNLGATQSSMSGLATATKDFTSNLTQSINPAQALTTEGKAQLDDLKQQLALLEIQRKELKVQKDAAGTKEEKAAIQAQIDQLQSQKDLLSLEKDKLSYAKQYGQESWNAADALKQAGQNSLEAGFAFGKSNLDQLQSDLGIGGGAITGAANALWDWGTHAASQFIFNVSNVDEAIAVKNNQVSKQAMQFSGR